MFKTIRKIKAAVPYAPPGVKASYLKINVRFDKLTVLIGPNASGKTAILESLGYIFSSMLKPLPSSLGLALTATLRPKRKIPSPFGGTVLLDNTKAASLILEPDPFLFLTKNNLEKIIYYSMDKNAKIFQNEIRKDIDTHSDILSELSASLHKYRYEYREVQYRVLNKVITNILGHRVDLAASSSMLGTKLLSIEEGIDNVVGRPLYRPREVKIAYTLFNNKIEKAIIFSGFNSIIVVKKQHSRSIEAPHVVVFHPGFIYWRGIFEGLYHTSVREGLPNEKDAINLLKNYIKWIEGYELLGRELHVRSRDGKRISVYNLSDGQRVAVFISLLYAISKPPVLFLLDTPEAFVHPDGLPVVADFITRLVYKGNQVIIATQSIEFLRVLLEKARESNILNDTMVERIELTDNGYIKAKGAWKGKVSLHSIESLGLDLRK